MEMREFSARYCVRSDLLAAVSFGATFAVYFLSLWLAIRLADIWPLCAVLVFLNAVSGVRLYVLQHDCGHLSLFRNPRANVLAGYALSVFTLTPFRAMQYNHNRHHANLGNLDERQTGEIHTMTLREWQAAGFWRRLGYRLYRNPLFLLPVGGVFVYALRYRWPKNTLTVGLYGVMAQNLALACWVGLIWLLAGKTGLWVYGATVFVAGVVGVFLVYLQHNFEDTYWDRKPDHKLTLAALQGSSALDLGHWFDLATGNIAYHDLHHFNPRIPSYRLRGAHQEMRKVYDMRVIKWPEALASFRLKLWDEDKERLVPFPSGARGRTMTAGQAG